MWTNKTNQWMSVLVLLCVATTCFGDDAAETQKLAEAHAEVSAPSALDNFKALAGIWEGIAQHGDEEPSKVIVTYAVTAGGSAVVETMFVGQPHEMLTVFHMVDGQLKLTHYCMLANQPEMIATESNDNNTVDFTFSGGANIADPDQDMYMHDASYTFIDADHFTTTWTSFNQGEPGNCAVIDLHRKKD